jgi:hypothetical protein
MMNMTFYNWRSFLLPVFFNELIVALGLHLEQMLITHFCFNRYAQNIIHNAFLFSSFLRLRKRKSTEWITDKNQKSITYQFIILAFDFKTKRILFSHFVNIKFIHRKVTTVVVLIQFIFILYRFFL